MRGSILSCRILANQGTQQDLVGFGERGRLYAMFRETVATVGTEFASDMVLLMN